MRPLFHLPFLAQSSPHHRASPPAASCGPHRRRPRHPHLSPRVAAAPGPGWQEPHRMHPFFAECAKKAPFLATSARNACFSRSRWQHPRPMHPFPGAIGRFRIHGARILPPRALFRVEEPEITHGAKMLPAPPGLSAAAACGPAEWVLRHAARAWPACRMRAPAISPAFIAAVLHASRFAARIAPTHAAIRRAAHCGRDELSIGLFLPPSCCPRRRIAPIDARSPAPPGPQPAPTEPQPRANRTPAPSQPGLVHPWSRLRPPAPRHSPRLTLPRGFRCGSGNSREMVR